ncbi:hypothetical protein COCSADRAFT_31449 [Bipolaris sorokiniana ND90Pr]|uniref:Uncharacterized protein n=1 Tax=Cochliobolus sativus (strain ND90Pr / ATCC 201652) TaxID=665912 RepID=M2SNM0_COCSN|nr:uncharacterized protein COCSADRAFT_31449 [Bipolaris sorokiniana ND90Pr]EMD58736.1 hypothetical protein COCSADRAFT_31449 [Bipolaris sorokiniana ND90Pr]
MQACDIWPPWARPTSSAPLARHVADEGATAGQTALRQDKCCCCCCWPWARADVVRRCSAARNTTMPCSMAAQAPADPPWAIRNYGGQDRHALVQPAAATPTAQAPTIVLPSSFNTLAEPISSLRRRGLGNSSFWPSPALMPSQCSPSHLAPSQSPPVNLPPQPGRQLCPETSIADQNNTPTPTPLPTHYALARTSSGSHSRAPVNLPQASARRRDAPRPHGRQ